MGIPELQQPCSHSEVVWEPVEIDYDADGTAAVSQSGRCDQCGGLLQLDYEAQEPRVVVPGQPDYNRLQPEI
jgi:hypothetical protein